MPLDSVVAQGWVDRVGRAGVPVAAVAALVGDPRTRAIDDVYPGLVALASQDEVAAGEAAGTLAAELLPRDRPARIAVIERSEEHTSELQSLMRISYAVFCLKKNNNITNDE